MVRERKREKPTTWEKREECEQNRMYNMLEFYYDLL